MKRPLSALSLLLAVIAIPFVGFAADHGDSPTAAASNEPTADITDLYAWMSRDGAKLNLVMAVNNAAGPAAVFSDAVTYVFSVSSAPAFRGADPSVTQESTRILCRFPDSANVECWAGGEYVVGDPGAEAGITSAGGGLRVFAGLRDDPFFLEYVGFQNAVDAAVGEVVAGRVTIPVSGCPVLTPAQGELLRGLLTSGDSGGPATNTFAGQNVLALVVEVDTSLVNSGGPILGVSASTHAAAN